MASHSQQGRVRKPLVPRDHGNFKQLLLTIKASGQCFCREELPQGPSAAPIPGSKGQTPQRSAQRLPSTQDCRLGLQCGAARSGEQRIADPSPYLFLSHGIDVLAVRAQHQVSQDGAAFMGHHVLILQSLVLPLGWQIHQDLWGEQGGMSMIPHTPQPPQDGGYRMCPIRDTTPPSTPKWQLQYQLLCKHPNPLQKTKLQCLPCFGTFVWCICTTFMLMTFISLQGGRTHPWLSHFRPLCAAAQPQNPSKL